MYSWKKKVGDIEVFILKDGETEFGVETFSGTNQSEINELLKVNHRKSIETNFNAFLIKSGGKNILIDAGAGTLFGPVAGNLSKALAEIGVINDDISNIIATHLHPDHIGGMISETGEQVFKNAALTLTQDEYSFWNKEENFKSNPEDQNLPLSVLAAYSENLNLTSGNADLGLGLSAIDLPGHTAGHIGIMISSGNDQMAIVGDIIHAQYLQINNPEIGVVFDQDVDQARQSRKKILDILAGEKMIFTGGHLLSPAIGYVEYKGLNYSWVQAGNDEI
ncbi:MAG: MBL fold metallo-hydrolase [Paracoccaceae bacterium]|jgi:glyoxylase-like metal-dependent hydrolase (beta-lactamase superfamily II)|nr:MBL fold metallo-hydrolase [Paracoccaceae bacterium]